MEKRHSLFTRDDGKIAPAFLEAVLNLTEATVELLQPVWEGEAITGFTYILAHGALRKNMRNDGVMGKKFLVETEEDEMRFQRMKEVIETGKTSEAVVFRRFNGVLNQLNERYVKFNDGVLLIRQHVDLTSTHISSNDTREQESTKGTDSLKRSDEILNHINEACYELDKNGIVVFVNRQALHWWRLEEAQVIGRNIWQIFPEAATSPCYDAIQTNALVNRQFAQYDYVSAVLNRWISLSAIPTGSGCIVVFRDIDASKKADQEVHRLKDEIAQTATEKYLGLFNNIEQGFCIIEVIFNGAGKAIDYRFMDINPVFERETGLKNALGKTMKELQPAHEDQWFDIYGNVVKTRRPVHFEMEAAHLGPAGREGGAWYEVYAFPFGSTDRNQVAVLFNNITERIRAELALRESEERFRSYVSAGFDVVYKMSADWQVMHNLEGKDFLADTNTATTSWLEKYIPDHEKQRVQNAIEGAIQHKKVFELEHEVIDANGSIAWTFSRAVPRLNDKGEIIEWIGTATNITIRKKEEEAQKEAEERLRILNTGLEQNVTVKTQELKDRTQELRDSTEKRKEDTHFITQILETTQDIAYIMDLNTYQLIYANRQIAVQLGYKKEQITQMNNPLFDIMHPDDIGRFKNHLKHIKTLMSDDKVVEIEYRLKDAHGGINWFCDRNSVFKRNSRRIPVEKLGFSQNITERKQQEERLLTGVNILNQAEEISGMGTWEYDIATDHLKWSEGMYQLFNLSKKVKPQPEIYFDYTPEDEHDVVDRIVKSIRYVDSGFDEIITLLPDEEEKKIIRVKAVVIKDKNKQPVKVIGVDLDITLPLKAAEEIKQLNDRLLIKFNELEVLNSELKTLNKITSNDYKNTLQVLYTNLEYIASTEARRLGDSAKANIRRAQSAIQKMQLLTSDITDYLQLYDIGINKSIIDPNTILQNVIAGMERKVLQANAKIELTHLPAIHADPFLFSLLLKNLLDNAVKFRKLVGDPIVKIKYWRADEINNIAGAQKNTPYTIVSISDNGLGIHEEDAEKIFDLFFRAYDSKYRGSGIGLAVCKKIMAMHNGLITVESTVGVGTTIICYFPEETQYQLDGDPTPKKF